MMERKREKRTHYHQKDYKTQTKEFHEWLH